MEKKGEELAGPTAARTASLQTQTHLLHSAPVGPRCPSQPTQLLVNQKAAEQPRGRRPPASGLRLGPCRATRPKGLEGGSQAPGSPPGTAREQLTRRPLLVSPGEAVCHTSQTRDFSFQIRDNKPEPSHDRLGK